MKISLVSLAAFASSQLKKVILRYCKVAENSPFPPRLPGRAPLKPLSRCKRQCIYSIILYRIWVEMRSWHYYITLHTFLHHVTCSLFIQSMDAKAEKVSAKAGKAPKAKAEKASPAKAEKSKSFAKASKVMNEASSQSEKAAKVAKATDAKTEKTSKASKSSTVSTKTSKASTKAEKSEH